MIFIIIRLENENDYCEVEKLVINTFWNIYRPGAFEHYIVHNLRKDESFIENLAFVVESDENIIAHINYSTGIIDYGDEKAEGVVLGPLSVEKKYQNQGIGSKLITYSLEKAQKMDIPYVFVIGDENYYQRFGFKSASEYNIYLEGTDTEDECPFFMIKVFDSLKLKDKRGIFHNPDVFHVDESCVDEFDRNFEYKEKLVLDGQLEGV